MRSGRNLTSDEIWNRLWDRISRQISAAGGLRGGRHSPPSSDGVPVDPKRPNTLIGGAAVRLDFED